MALNDVVKTLIDELKNSIQCQTVIGNPIVAGEITIIPVSKVSFGFAAGGGEKKKLPGFGAGTGGGASVEPVAFIVISGNDVKVMGLKKSDKWMDKLLDPENYEKLNEVFKKIKKGGKKFGRSEDKTED
ncbi:MAG: sporulation protein [Candidatus Muirbacterium halophilum]|nr:sporulation protein [Candidatus Muirbacterium halophilum]